MRKLAAPQLVRLQGGDLTQDIDGFCAGVGLGLLFGGTALVPGAFCVGWAIGRLF